MSIFGQGAFQIDPNATPEQIARKRELIAALMPQYGKARYVGEGLGHLATGFVAGRKGKKLDAAEARGTAGAGDLFSRIVGAGGRDSPLSVLGPKPMPDPSSPQAIAGDTMRALGKSKPSGGRDSFISEMMPHAIRVSEKTGLDPRLVIAQAAQETGWGKSAPGNNFFGIKSHGRAGGNTMATNEVIGGQTVRVNDSFRGYGDAGESADDYANFLMENPRYKDMLSAGDLEGQVAALGRSGYATDPNYANSIMSIASSIQAPQLGAPTASAKDMPATPAGGQPSLQDLYAAMSNPWMNPQQRSIIASMIEQQQQQSDPMRQIQLAQARLDLEQSKAGKSSNVQSSVLLDDGTAVMLMNDGSRRVLSADDQPLFGQAAADAIMKAREYTVQNQQDIYSGRRSGTLGADIELGGAAEAAKDIGKATVAAGMDAWASYGKLNTSLANIDEAIRAIDSGAKSGPVYKMLPSVTEASAALENAMNRMGLDVVGAVTFGALSEGELRLAMSTAVPQNLEPGALRNWLVRRRDAQAKAAAMAADAAQFMTVPGNTINGWIAKNRGEKPQAQPSATHRFNPETGQIEAIQ